VATSKSSCCLRKLEAPGYFSKTLTNISVLSPHRNGPHSTPAMLMPRSVTVVF
jgi:hypothetical protein